MQVVIYYIENEAGQVAVIPDPKRSDKTLGFAKDKLGIDTTDASSQLDKLFADAMDSGNLRHRDFDLKPYTYGQKIEATRVSTTVVNGNMITDQATLNMELICASSGMKREDVKNLPNSIAQALFEEVRFLSEPDPDRLLFLSQSHTAGQQTE